MIDQRCQYEPCTLSLVRRCKVAGRQSRPGRLEGARRGRDLDGYHITVQSISVESRLGGIVRYDVLPKLVT